MDSTGTTLGFGGWELNHGQQVRVGKDEGGRGLGPKESYEDCVVVEYVWIDAHNTCRSKTKTVTKRPASVEDLPIWNFDGSSTDQAPGKCANDDDEETHEV